MPESEWGRKGSNLRPRDYEASRARTSDDIPFLHLYICAGCGAAHETITAPVGGRPVDCPWCDLAAETGGTCTVHGRGDGQNLAAQLPQTEG